MITVKKSEERRYVGTDAQQTWMTFDWENKADPLHDGFGSLLLLNEEILSPGTGFILHTHRDMIVVTYVREGMIIASGPLENPGLVRTEEFHLVAAAAGMCRESFGVLDAGKAHFFQSAFLPGTGPGKTIGVQKLFTQADRKGVLRLVASPDGRDGSIPIHQDVRIYSSFIYKGNHIIHELASGRRAWLHVVSGLLQLGDLPLGTGDGAGLAHERSVSFTAQAPTEILLFDLA